MKIKFLNLVPGVGQAPPHLGKMSLTIAMAWCFGTTGPNGLADDELPRTESDLVTPAMTDEEPAPGKRVRQVAPEYAGTSVYHSLYLPENWEPGRLYPVIVEYTGNRFPPANGSGEMKDANLGYGMSGGVDYIWVVMPYIEKGGQENAVRWWGDRDLTVEYCKTNLPRICSEFGGDPDNLFVCGFSRGAIGSSYIGLADDEIASFWKAMFTHDHFDGQKKWGYPESDRTSALERLSRLKGRPVLICGQNASGVREGYLEDHLDLANFAFLDVPTTKIFSIPEGQFNHAHTDLWMHRASAYRDKARAWLANQVAREVSEPLPEVEVRNVRRAFHNGEHNAFTDLISWNGRIWLTFRSCPDGHMVFSTSRIIILSSDDRGESWKKEHEFSVPLRDTRDPHFLAFRDRLFVYTGTWFSGEGELPRSKYDINKHLGYAVHTGDGKEWSPPVQLEGTYGHYIWRAASHGDKAYLCGRRKKHYSESESGTGGARVLESALLESEDGLIWRFRSLFQTERGNETAFLFEADGSLLSLSRSENRKTDLGRSQPPYLQWDRKTLETYLGGPLLVKWGTRYLAGGRHHGKEGARTRLYWLEDDRLHTFAELPSGGDNSYPGFVAFDEKEGLVSWYSSHEKDAEGNPITAIYVANLVRK